MSFLNLFTSKPAVPVAAPAPVVAPVVAPTPTLPGNIPTSTVAPQPGNTTVPVTTDTTVPPTQDNKDDSPLAQFSKLWENEPTKEGDNQNPAPVTAVTQEQLQKVMGKLDLTSAVTPEQMTAIAAGGEEATKAMMQMMNTVAQQTMIQSTLVTSKLTEKAIEAAVAQQTKAIEVQTRAQAVKSHAVDTNPIFKNPAVAPIVAATQEQLIQKFPQATPAEITEMTQSFILAMGKEFAPAVEADPTATTGENTDWTKFA